MGVYNTFVTGLISKEKAEILEKNLDIFVLAKNVVVYKKHSIDRMFWFTGIIKTSIQDIDWYSINKEIDVDMVSINSEGYVNKFVFN